MYKISEWNPKYIKRANLKYDDPKYIKIINTNYLIRTEQ